MKDKISVRDRIRMGIFITILTGGVGLLIIGAVLGIKNVACKIGAWSRQKCVYKTNERIYAELQ